MTQQIRILLILLGVGLTGVAQDAPIKVLLAGTSPEDESVAVSFSGDGSVRLARPRGKKPRALVPITIAVIPAADMAVSGSVRAAGLWKRDARILLEFRAASGRVLRRAQTPQVIRNQAWGEVVGYATVPGGAVEGRIVLSLAGKEDGELDRKGFAEFRDVVIRRVPGVSLVGPDLGVARLDQPLTLQLSLRDVPTGAGWSAELVNVFGSVVAVWETKAATDTRTFADLAAGYYELRWQVGSADAPPLREGRASYMVLDPTPREDTTPWAVDAGFSWGIVQRGDQAMQRIATLLYDIGLRRVRDRFSLSSTYRTPDQLACKEYKRAAQAQTSAGLRVYQIMHDIPPWMAPDPKDPMARKAPPADLRQLHRFFELAARELRGIVDAWEVWNEPDISFFAGRPEEYAAILKAAYLGVKKGNPDARVLIGSPAHPLDRWLHLVFESGVTDYYDTFNWHTYRGIGSIPSDTAAFRELQRAHGCDYPMWLTETGDTAYPINGDVLAGERRQAALYAKRYIIAAANRIERVFAFYLQEWRQPGALWFGLIRRDFSPRPGLAALAGLTRRLGRGQPLGAGSALPQHTSVYWFESGSGPVAVAWASEPVPWPASLQGGTVHSMMGARIETPRELSEDPVYVTALKTPADLIPAPPLPTPAVRTPQDIAQRSVILEVRLLPAEDIPLGDPQRKQPVGVIPGDVIPAQLAVYNFADTPADVTLRLAVPETWQATPLKTSIRVAPGERVLQVTTLTAGHVPKLIDVVRLWVTAEAPGFQIAPAVAGLVADADRLPVQVLTRLSDLPDASDSWSVSHNKPVQLVLGDRDAKGWLRLAYQLSEPRGNRWGFAQLPMRQDVRLADGNAIRFRLRVREAWSEKLIVILHERDGSQYHANAAKLWDTDERDIQLLWRQFRLNRGVSKDENNQLDLGQVDKISFGVSARSPAQEASFELGPVDLVRLNLIP